MFSVKGKIVDVEREKITDETIFIEDGRIRAVGAELYANEHYDYSDFYIVPGFIDARVNIESSMLTPSRFSDAVLPHGTVAVVADPRKIANVSGMDGIDFMLDDSKNIPLRVSLTAPVLSGRGINAKDIQELLSKPKIVALDGVDPDRVIKKEKSVIASINAAKEERKPIDGDASGLTGKDLERYIEAGITADRSTTVKEIKERLSVGIKVMLNGSVIDDLGNIKGIVKDNIENLMLVSNCSKPCITDGHINKILRKTVNLGVDPIHALRMVSLNPARHYKLPFLGNVCIGMKASFVVVRDLKDFEIIDVFIRGDLVVKDGNLLNESEKAEIPKKIRSVNIGAIKQKDLMIISKKSSKVRVISFPDKEESVKLESNGENLVPNIKNDILPAVFIERYKVNGKIGKGFVKSLGLKSGAIASTFDSDSLICFGTNYRDMDYAIREIKKTGGIITVKDKKTLSLIELPVAGLMSDKSMEDVSKDLEKLDKSIKSLGCKISFDEFPKIVDSLVKEPKK